MASAAPEPDRHDRRAAYLAVGITLLLVLLYALWGQRSANRYSDDGLAATPRAAVSSPSASSAAQSELLIRVLFDTRPVSGARITLAPGDAPAETLQRGPTGANGLVRISGLEAAEYSVVVERDGFLTHRQQVVLARAPLTLEVVLTPSVVSVASAVAKPGKRVSGRVVSQTGEPIAGASVGSGDPGSVFATTDDNGYFELSGLGDSPAAVFATAPGFAARHRRGVLPGTQGVTLELEPAAVVRGAFDWPSGASRIDVSVCHYDAFFRREICIARRTYRATAATYEIPSLPSGNYDLVAETQGRTPQRFPLKLTPGAVVEGPSVAFTD